MRIIVYRVLLLVSAILLLPITAAPIQAAMPPAALSHDALSLTSTCTTFRDVLAGGLRNSADFGCLPSEKRMELLSRAPAPRLIASLDREYRQHSALHQWKAQEAAALALPPPGDASPASGYPRSTHPLPSHPLPSYPLPSYPLPSYPLPSYPLSAYLESRDIESKRSEALKETRQAIVRGEARILHLGVELNEATRAAAQWIQRQPRRVPPAAYLQRIVAAADAILAEELLLNSHGAERDHLNQRFDEQLQEVLTLQG